MRGLCRPRLARVPLQGVPRCRGEVRPCRSRPHARTLDEAGRRTERPPGAMRPGARRGPRAATLPPYGNCAVLPPDSDVVMFRCNDDRRSWYLSRGLAAVVSKDPAVIRLTFKPN